MSILIFLIPLAIAAGVVWLAWEDWIDRLPSKGHDWTKAREILKKIEDKNRLN